MRTTLTPQSLAIARVVFFAFGLPAIAAVQAAELAQIEVALEKPGDTAKVRAIEGGVAVAVESKTGIGSVTLTRPGEKWPKRLIVDLHLSGLEMLQLKAGDVV